jgi:RNA polymerase sigma factor (sigma-70 family)
VREELDVTDPEAFLRVAIPLLTRIAMRRFSIPSHDAQDLAHDVLLSFLGARSHVRNARQFLVGAISNASRSYWRRSRRRLISLEDAPESRLSISDDQRGLLLHDVVRRLRQSHRQIVLLRVDGYSIREIALRLGITPSAADKRLRVALRRARVIAESGGEDAVADVESQQQFGPAALRPIQTPLAVIGNASESVRTLRWPARAARLHIRWRAVMLRGVRSCETVLASAVLASTG